MRGHLWKRLGVEVALAETGPAVSGLEKARPVSLESTRLTLAGKGANNVASHHLALPAGEDPRFRQRLAHPESNARAVADGIDAGEPRGERMAIDGHPTAVVHQTGLPSDSGSPMGRNVSEQVEVGSSTVGELDVLVAGYGRDDLVLGVVADSLALDHLPNASRDVGAGHTHGAGLRGVEVDLHPPADSPAAALVLEQHRRLVGRSGALVSGSGRQDDEPAGAEIPQRGP
jgi:hypothetical protein